MGRGECGVGSLYSTLMHFEPSLLHQAGIHTATHTPESWASQFYSAHPPTQLLMDGVYGTGVRRGRGKWRKEEWSRQRERIGGRCGMGSGGEKIGRGEAKLKTLYKFSTASLANTTSIFHFFLLLKRFTICCGGP